MKAPGELAGFWTRMGELDDQIASLHEDGYCCDVVLEERLEWQRERDELLAGLPS